jgi:hypothetical protein
VEQIADAVRRLARTKDIRVPCSKQMARRLDAIELVRQHREERTQELAYHSRPFVLCGLPIRRPPPGTLRHTRRNGRLTLEVIGHPSYGLPFGQDRLVPLWVATMAVRQQSRTILFESGAEILRTFGLPPDGIHYDRLVAAFQRIFASTIYFGSDQIGNRSTVWDCRRFHFFDRLKVWRSQADAEVDEARPRNVVTLSEAFWEEIQAHPIPVDLAAVRSLAHNPGCLDLYMWLTWRCYNAKRTEAVPLYGASGLCYQLGVGEYSRARNFRKRVRAWLETVRLHWPDCPARISADGETLTIGPATPIHQTDSIHH